MRRPEYSIDIVLAHIKKLRESEEYPEIFARYWSNSCRNSGILHWHETISRWQWRRHFGCSNSRRRSAEYNNNLNSLIDEAWQCKWCTSLKLLDSIAQLRVTLKFPSIYKLFRIFRTWPNLKHLMIHYSSLQVRTDPKQTLIWAILIHKCSVILMLSLKKHLRGLILRGIPRLIKEPKATIKMHFLFTKVFLFQSKFLEIVVFNGDCAVLFVGSS